MIDDPFKFKSEYDNLVNTNVSLTKDLQLKTQALAQTSSQLQDKNKLMKDIKQKFVKKMKELSQWTEKHLSLNNFKEVKFADDDEDSSDQSDSDHTSLNQSTAAQKMN
jgi:hypothetical protein